MQVAPLPRDLQDRRVEITGPVDRKMVINALNSGAHTYMADFEDSSAPTWCVLPSVCSPACFCDVCLHLVLNGIGANDKRCGME